MIVVGKEFELLRRCQVESKTSFLSMKATIVLCLYFLRLSRHIHIHNMHTYGYAHLHTYITCVEQIRTYNTLYLIFCFFLTY